MDTDATIATAQPAASSPLVPHAATMRAYLQHHAAAPSNVDLLTPLPRFIRMNPRAPLALSELERQLSTTLAPTALPSFYSLPSSVQIADKSCYKLGSVYGMDLASGLSVHVLDVRPGHKVLDLCAAPGNKLAMIADTMGTGEAHAAAAASAASSSSSAAAAASPSACAALSVASAPSGSVVGVDWSYARLAATRTLLRKYRHSASHVQLYLADGQTFERPAKNEQQLTLPSSTRRPTELHIIDLTQQPRSASTASVAIASPANFHVAGSADSSVWRAPVAAAAGSSASSSTAASSAAAAAAASSPPAPVVLRVTKREKRAMTKQHKRAEWEKKRKRDEGRDAEDTTTTAADAAAAETKSPELDSTTVASDSCIIPLGPELYDRVLVDAECTHDGAHKHMMSIAQAEALEGTAGAADCATASAASAASPASSPTPSSAPTWSAFTARYFSSAHLSSLEVLQRALLRNGFRLLRPGGALVYSTCSFLRRQNEEVVAWLLSQEPKARAVDVWEGVDGAGTVEKIVDATTDAADAGAGLFRVSLRPDLPALTFSVAPNPHAQSSSASATDAASAAAAAVPLGIRLSPWTSGTSGLFIAKITKLAD